MNGRRRIVFTVLAALALFACGSRMVVDDGASPPPILLGTVTVSDTGCELSATGPFRPGRIRLIVVNTTSGFAAFDMWRISAGSTYQDLVAHVEKEMQLAADGQAGLGYPSFAGDLRAVEMTGPATADLPNTISRGTYGIVCLGDTPGGRRPVGIVGPIEVR